MAESAESHRQAAAQYEAAADGSERLARLWEARGERARAELGSRIAAHQREGAALERAWAELIESDGQRVGPDSAQRSEVGVETASRDQARNVEQRETELESRETGLLTRESEAKRRDFTGDMREELADEREREADAREHAADLREQLADEREGTAEAREVERRERSRRRGEREHASSDRQQAAIERETAASEKELRRD